VKATSFGEFVKEIILHENSRLTVNIIRTEQILKERSEYLLTLAQ
jgi:hypothetical protein